MTKFCDYLGKSFMVLHKFWPNINKYILSSGHTGTHIVDAQL